jgi:hypothetical protein
LRALKRAQKKKKDIDPDHEIYRAGKYEGNRVPRALPWALIEPPLWGEESNGQIPASHPNHCIFRLSS